MASEIEQFKDNLEFDFRAFSQLPTVLPTHKVSLSVVKGAATPPEGLRQTFRGPHGVCFDVADQRHILYPGPVWLKYDFGSDEGTLTGVDLSSLYQRLYLTILSRVGEWLDKRGLHRIHALGVDSPLGGCLFLMPTGMGKSTLAVSLLGSPGWALLSEDTPLIDRHGKLHPFPFRLGLRHQDQANHLPAEALREQLPKTLVQADHFPICRHPIDAKHIFVGAWTTGAPAIETLSRAGCFSALFRDAVVGVGLPQVAELFIRRTKADVLSKAGLALSRLRTVVAVQKRCSRARIFLSQDVSQNVEILNRWARRESLGAFDLPTPPGQVFQE